MYLHWLRKLVSPRGSRRIHSVASAGQKSSGVKSEFPWSDLKCWNEPLPERKEKLFQLKIIRGTKIFFIFNRENNFISLFWKERNTFSLPTRMRSLGWQQRVYMWLLLSLLLLIPNSVKESVSESRFPHVEILKSLYFSENKMSS